VTIAPGPAGGRWARCGGALYSRTSTGTMILPVDGRTAVSLSDAEHAVWVLTAEPATVDTLTTSVDASSVWSALANLTALGVVRKVS
jgi:hypothetical protein